MLNDNLYKFFLKLARIINLFDITVIYQKTTDIKTAMKQSDILLHRGRGIPTNFTKKVLLFTPYSKLQRFPARYVNKVN